MDKKKALDKNFLSFVEKIKNKFNSKVILFGSRAKGEAIEYSDYDIIVISKKFENVRWIKRIEQVVEHWELDKDIDVLPYTPEEFLEKKKQICIVKQAVKEGIVL